MSNKAGTTAVRILPEDVANKIAAGEVVERPASVVKELVENALDAGATRIVVRLVAAGRRTIEIVDNGHGMSEQDALLALERHATSKIRKAEDLDNILTFGFRGEALPSIAAVSRFELVTRRLTDAAATRIRVEGGVFRDVTKIAGPAGTRVTVNRLYFNTPVRAKFLKGITTELSQCIDVVQRHTLSAVGVGFQLLHNDKVLLDAPENASLRERVALIWGLSFLQDLVEVDSERDGLRIVGLIGTPRLTRSQRTHQFFFLNRRPVVNRALQYGFEDGYQGLLTVGRRPVGIVLMEVNPRLVDVNIHPTKREVRFRDDRAVQQIIRDLVRERLAHLTPGPPAEDRLQRTAVPAASREPTEHVEAKTAVPTCVDDAVGAPGAPVRPPRPVTAPGVQTEFVKRVRRGSTEELQPEAVFEPIGTVTDAPMQLFDTYLLAPEEDRLLIIDQHALHERLMYEMLRSELEDGAYEAQQLVVPLLVDVPPSHIKLLESHLALFSKLGIEMEPFGGNTYQVTAICHLYEESKVSDAVCRVLDILAQGDLFAEEAFVADMLRVTVEACRGAVKAGDRLTPEERRGLLDGFRRLQPPYTCPHGRPILVELTQVQMEKSFRRRP